MKIIKQVLSLFEKRDKVNLFGVLLLMLSGGFLEMLGIGLIYPFMSLITSPELVEQNMQLKSLYQTLPISTHTGFVIVMGLLLVGVIVVKNPQTPFFPPAAGKITQNTLFYTVFHAYFHLTPFWPAAGGNFWHSALVKRDFL